jgi:hypothetical protein
MYFQNELIDRYYKEVLSTILPGLKQETPKSWGFSSSNTKSNKYESNISLRDIEMATYV